MPAIVPKQNDIEDPSVKVVKAVNLTVDAEASEEAEVVVESEETRNQNLISDLLKSLTESTVADERKAAAENLAALVAKIGLQSLHNTYAILASLKAAAVHKKSTGAREGAHLAFAALSHNFGQASEPYLIPILPMILDGYSDKQAVVRQAAEAAGMAVLSRPSCYAIPLLLPILFEAITNSKWQSKVASLNLIASMAKSFPDQIKAALPGIVPVVSAAMWDTKSDVTKAATATLLEACAVVGNPDIVPAIPKIIGCIAKPEKVPDTIYALSATTFVTQVEAPALAIITPLLDRGLSERTPATQRQTAVIIDNMCKLVENPADVIQFLPKLLPGIERIIEIAANPELRTVADRARATLLRVSAADAQDPNLSSTLEETPATIQSQLKREIASALSSAEVDDLTLSYVSSLVAQLIAQRSFSAESWNACIINYLVTFVPLDCAETVATRLLTHYVELDKKLRKDASKEADEEEGELLCAAEFSLAYGGMILLNNTILKLRRGQRYGLCGPNGAGKSTLMRSIAEGKLEGFPSADELRTVFVEHNLQASEAELSVVEFVASDSKLSSMSKQEIVDMLASVGFDETMQSQAVGSLSGGWKMKLELAKAILLRADVLLLDEPTNHLDTLNVAWLENYLCGLTDVTCMIVSHDSSFLDHVCTNIIHYENRKLRAYKGNLSEFVKQRPEAQSYYKLTSATHKFKLPEPGFLDGVKSKDKAILKMAKVGFMYPGSTKQTVSNISVQCSLNSRVGVQGPNGAGKSTVIKLLTGELVPNTGDITRHPNLRVAYVAQHAFHHVEMHLDKTPNEYIRWRYQYGEDRELLASASRAISPEEEKAMKKVIIFETEKRQLDALQGRRKAKRSFEYEVQWVGKSYESNSWVSREQLCEWGFDKVVQAFDDKEAAKAGAWTRSLTALEVEKHLADLGLDAEFATHSRIRGLSGGQKVKVVIGAAMWLNPHLLVLDEPTNYLDRDSLGALSEAVMEFGGGVVIISHSKEFISAVCSESWKVDTGVLTLEGNNYTQKAEKIEMKEAETKIDAFGNVEKVKSQKKLTRKEKMQKQKKRAAARKNGEVLSDWSEEDL